MQDHDLALQLDTLHGIRCRKVLEEKASGTQQGKISRIKAALRRGAWLGRS